MASIVRNFASFVGGSAWSDLATVLSDGGAVDAYVDDPSEAGQITSADLSDLPSSCNIVGIAIRIDAYKVEGGFGSGTLQVGAELSYNNGTNYTSTSKKTGNLTGTQATYTLGGATDTWGRSWTRSEMQSGTFRLRITSLYTSILDNPEWHVEYVRVTVYYEDTTALTVDVAEVVHATEAVEFDKLELDIYESVRASEGGSLRGGGYEQTTFAGDVENFLTGIPAGFSSAAASQNAPHGLSVIIFLQGAAVSRTLFIAEPAIADALSGTGLFQRGLVHTGDIVLEGAPAAEVGYNECTVAIRNDVYAAGTVVDWITTFMRDTYVTGQQLQVFAWAKEATWQQVMLFSGAIVEVQTTESAVEFRCADIRRDLAQIPALEVTPDGMQYGTDEGSMPPEAVGTVVPIVYGRCSYEAVTSVASTHPLYQFKGYGHIIAPALGIKTPCFPLAFIADNYRRRTGDTAAQTMRHALFAFGDRNLAAPIQAQVAPLRYPDSTSRFKDSYRRQYWTNLFTWDSSLDRALPFIADESTDLDAIELQMDGAGDYLAKRGDVTGAAFPLAKVHGFFINRTNPGFAAPKRLWPAVLQSVAVDAEKLDESKGTVPNAANTPMATTAGVTNAENAFSTDPNTYATIPQGDRLAMQFRPDCSSLGLILSIRVVLLFGSGSAATQTRVWCRTGFGRADSAAPGSTLLPLHEMDIDTATGGTDAGADFNSSSDKIGAYILLDTRREPPYDKWPGWKFVTDCYDPVTHNTPTYEQPFAILVESKVGTTRLAHAWLEVIYRPRTQGLAAGSGQPDDQRFSRQRTQGQALVSESDFATIRITSRKVANPVETSPPNFKVFGACAYTVKDDASGTFTGASNRILENPPDICGHVIAAYLGEFAKRAVGTEFGSFVRARDTLNTLIGPGGTDFCRVTAVVDQRTTVKSFFGQMQNHCRGFVQRQPSGSDYQWRFFIDSPAPHTDAPERLYRTDGWSFGWRDFARVQDRIVVTEPPLDEFATGITLNYGFHLPTRKYAYRMFVSPNSDNLLTAGSTYRAACAATRNRLGGLDQTRTVDLPWLWHDKLADALCKYHYNVRSQRYLTVTFICLPQFIDLRPGHVIKFADEIGDRIKYQGPGGAANWNAHYFNVRRVDIIREASLPMHVRVVATEVYSEP